VRLRKNPLAYGCPYDQAREDPGMGRFRETLLRDACKRLDESRMCRYDRRSGAVAGTEVGRVGSHFYLRHESVREFNERLRQHATDADILVVVCSAYEFEQLKPRSDEVAELDRLRESEVCCPVRSDELFALADEPAGKAATLLQAHVSRAPFSAFTLASDAGQDKRAKFPTSKPPISAGFHSFRLIFGRAIISRNGLEAWMLFPGRARAERSR